MNACSGDAYARAEGYLSTTTSHRHLGEINYETDLPPTAGQCLLVAHVVLYIIYIT
jgi:hypothetical protein